MSGQPSFQVVAERPAPVAKTEKADDANQIVALITQLLSITALSQRAAVALAKLFTLLTVGSAFVLWYNVPDPTVTQIVSLAIYAVFVLAINAILLWRK